MEKFYLIAFVANNQWYFTNVHSVQGDAMKDYIKQEFNLCTNPKFIELELESPNETDAG